MIQPDSGDTLLDQKAARVDDYKSVTPDVDQKTNVLLSRSHAVDAHQSRVILQTLRIDRIPLNELQYKYAGVERTLWICGHQNEVYAPKAPWNRSLFTVLTSAAVLAMIGLIAGVVYLLVR